MCRGADGMWWCSHYIHKQPDVQLHSEFLLHILSTGCVMMPFIKVGNCLTEVLRYWIRGQFCRHKWRQLDVKSLSSEIGSRAEQAHRGWYQHQREMLALCCLTLVNGTQSTCYPILPWDSHWLCPPCPLQSDTQQFLGHQIVSLQRYLHK